MTRVDTLHNLAHYANKRGTQYKIIGYNQKIKNKHFVGDV